METMAKRKPNPLKYVDWWDWPEWAREQKSELLYEKTLEENEGSVHMTFLDLEGMLRFGEDVEDYHFCAMVKYTMDKYFDY